MAENVFAVRSLGTFRDYHRDTFVRKSCKQTTSICLHRRSSRRNVGAYAFGGSVCVYHDEQGYIATITICTGKERTGHFVAYVIYIHVWPAYSSFLVLRPFVNHYNDKSLTFAYKYFFLFFSCNYARLNSTLTNIIFSLNLHSFNTMCVVCAYGDLSHVGWADILELQWHCFIVLRELDFFLLCETF